MADPFNFHAQSIHLSHINVLAKKAEESCYYSEEDAKVNEV